MLHVNGALTIGENIEDLSGVTIVIKAYAFALQESRIKKSTETKKQLAKLLWMRTHLVSWNNENDCVHITHK